PDPHSFPTRRSSDLEPFAHMVENRNLIDALAARAEAAGVDLRPTAVNSYEANTDGIDVVLADGSTIAASLLVAADGARSKLRERSEEHTSELQSRGH